MYSVVGSGEIKPAGSKSEILHGYRNIIYLDAREVSMNGIVSQTPTRIAGSSPGASYDDG
jgi:hypothetical protein